MRKPHLCQKQGRRRTRAKSYSQLLFQAAHLSHRHLPGKKRPLQAATEGCRLAQVTIDDPEYQRAAGLWDERGPCLGLCPPM